MKHTFQDVTFLSSISSVTSQGTNPEFFYLVPTNSLISDFVIASLLLLLSLFKFLLGSLIFLWGILEAQK